MGVEGRWVGPHRAAAAAAAVEVSARLLHPPCTPAPAPAPRPNLSTCPSRPPPGPRAWGRSGQGHGRAGATAAVVYRMASQLAAAPQGAAEAAAAGVPEKVYLNPLVSHPVGDAALKGAMDGGASDGGATPLSPASTIGSPSTGGAGSSSGRGGGGGGGGGGGDRHLRRMTQSLVDILEAISGSVAPPGKGARAARAAGSRVCMHAQRA